MVRSLAEALISRRSITPQDDGCQRLVIERLTPLGFSYETIQSGSVTNLWAIRRGTGSGPTFAFAGHTDVVPPGPIEQWQTDPFAPAVRNGKLYGRGAADMKSSIAAFVVALEEYLAATEPSGHVAVLLTSDEEGAATDGTVKIVQALAARGQRLDYCLLGEPTSAKVFGDTIKNGRRGSLSARLVVRGVQGHVAYPELARNAIHLAAPAIQSLVSERWDEGDEYFPPTTFQISNYRAGAGAENIAPGEATIDFNFRFSPASPPQGLQQRVESILRRHDLDFTLHWTLSARPFLTPRGALSDAVSQAIHAETGVTPELSTSGGTSDGRFLASICEQVCEFGPANATIHKVDEHVDVSCLEPLKNIYRRVLAALLAG